MAPVVSTLWKLSFEQMQMDDKEEKQFSPSLQPMGWVTPIVKNTFINFPLDKESLEIRRSRSEPFITMENSTEEIVWKEYQDFGAYTGAMESLGSIGHREGACRPCAWHWKEGGCHKGTTCEFCHLCDAGAVKLRKKKRLASIKAQKASRKQLPVGRILRHPESCEIILALQ
mmetsp:Transcript_99842/g.177105  ORF Transcript_99842/g.177105 Transcript_99842/m.177105 type:complete len:172 (+) Transcript_99842:79-594(+)